MSIQINSLNPSDYILVDNNTLKTTSLKVAEAFGKLHKNIISKIEGIECSKEFAELNFKPSEYVDGTGRKLPMYEMTKDGFVFLVMSFTGKKAAMIKEAYINAFNWMADQIKDLQKRSYIDGRSTPRAIRTFDKIIEVNVTTTQKISLFFKNNWQWLWAAILVPVAGWLWKRRKKQLTITSS